MNRIQGFQAARGIACLSIVIAHHAYLLEIAYGLTPASALDYPGRYGMLQLTSIFFVLCGFFVTKAVLTAKENSNPVRFLFRRMLRLYPMYWLAIGFCCIMKLCAYGYVAVGETKYFLKGLFLQGNGSYLLNGEWTMIYDLVLYAVSSVFANTHLKRFYPAFVLAWGVVIVFSITPNRLAGIDLTMPLILTNGNVLGYVVGMLVYLLYNWLQKTRITEAVRKTNISPVVFLCGIMLMLFRVEIIGINKLYQILLYYVVVFVTMVSAMYLPISNKNILVKIGDHSFGIYLIHFTIGGIITTALKDYLPIWFNGGIAICIAVLVGYGFDLLGNDFSRITSEKCEALGSVLSLRLKRKK